MEILNLLLVKEENFQEEYFHQFFYRLYLSIHQLLPIEHYLFECQKLIFLLVLITNTFFSKNFSLDQSKTVLMKLNESVFALDATNCTCLYDIGCGIGNLCMTKNNSCTQQAECGLFGSSNCKGTCDNTTGPITP